MVIILGMQFLTINDCRMLHLPPDKSRLLMDRGTRSVKEFTAKYVVDNRTIYNILNQICKDKDLYPCVKKHTSPQETAEGHFIP